MRRTWLLAGALLLSGCTTHTVSPLVAAATSAPAPTSSSFALSSSPTLSPSRAPSPSPRPSPSAAPSARPSPRESPYPWSSRSVTASELGASWHRGCPVGPSSLRLVSLPYRDFSGVRHVGRLVVHRDAVARVAAVFGELYAARFPIRSMRPVSEYGGSDDRSMAADNTSAFTCRDAVGGSGWSQHAYGKAVDVNTVENPYVLQGRAMPPAGRAYVDRSRHRPGMAYPSSVLNRAFARRGFGWGGGWDNPDYQHFSTNGR